LKLFLDSADLAEVRAAAPDIDGITMNPALLARARVAVEEFVPQAAALVRGTVSVPVRATECDAIVREGRSLAKLHDAVAVKIGIDPEGVRAIARLHSEGIRTHATLCCSANQALVAARAGADWVSPLLGRLDAIGASGLELLAQVIEIYDQYDFDTQIMVASLRSPADVQEVARLGADAITAGWRILDVLARHPLTDSMQRDFQADWNKL
jgi:transaldolase